MENCRNQNCNKKPLWPREGFCENCHRAYLEELKKQHEIESEDNLQRREK